MQNRRQFIKKISWLSTGSICILTTSLATTGVLQSCSTIDDYLIADPNDLTDHVVIIGGGISGLYAAYQLKKRKIPYRIFEASHRLGGKILSNQNFEYGPFEFLNSDQALLTLVKDLKLRTEKVDSKSWIFKNGTQDFINELTIRVAGVLPKQQIRLKHKLIGFADQAGKFKISFSTFSSDKTYSASKILFALPAQDLIQIKGLQLENLNAQIGLEQQLRLVLPLQKWGQKISSNKIKKISIEGIQCSYRQIKNLTYFTLTFATTLASATSVIPAEIEKLELWVSEKLLEDSPNSIHLEPEHIYMWHSQKRSALFDQKAFDTKFKKNQIVISDGLILPTQRVETLLMTINHRIDQML